MALKGDRITSIPQDIRYFMSVTGERGSLVVLNTTYVATGVAIDDPSCICKLPAVAEGSGEIPVGILLCDVVNKDLTQTHLNQHKNEVQVNSKVEVSRRGTYTTNMLTGTPSPGDNAYFTLGGKFTDWAMSFGSTKVGKWLSAPDADGYATIEVNII